MNCIDCDIPFSVRDFYRNDNSKPHDKVLVRCRQCRLNRRGNNIVADRRIFEFYRLVRLNGGKVKNKMISCGCGSYIRTISFRKHIISRTHNRPCNPIENLNLFFQI